MIPISHYLYAASAITVIFIYNFLEWHLISDALTGFRGHRVSLTFNPDCKLYHEVVSFCKILNGRYLATPWLASPHIQTTFLGFLGRPPVFHYRREIFHAADGGNFALDWLLGSDVAHEADKMSDGISKEDSTPIVIVVPGLTSDSESRYMKYLVHGIAKCGWNVVASNHRGLGGVSVTSDCFYNGGWTEDIRAVVHHLHNEYPHAPLYVIGTSLGANMLVKYLGEEGDDIPIAGAVAVCSPWDFVIGDRFMGRKLIQKLYARVLTIGLQGYAQLHQPRFLRLANWEGIMQSRSLREFDNHATRIVGKYETVDAFYRHSSSTAYMGNVAVPLLCISALDDPVCTKEAIPWDECRLNKNIVLATTRHGGHLAFFEGITGSSLWWVRAVTEFLGILHSSSCTHAPKQMKICDHHPAPESSIDHSPFVHLVQDGTVAAVADGQIRNGEGEKDLSEPVSTSDHDPSEGQITEEVSSTEPTDSTSSNHRISNNSDFNVILTLIRGRLDHLCRYSKRSMWLLVYISIVSSWPLMGSLLNFFLKRKGRKMLTLTSQRR